MYARPMTDLFTLGKLYPSDFLAPGESPRAEPVELKLVFDDATKRVHLEQTADHDVMYGRYWYRSGTNATMTKELAGIVDSIEAVKQLDVEDVWLDIASNDGTLLRHVSPGLVRVGIDPADDTFADEARQHADEIVQAPFTRAAYEGSIAGDRRADVVTCIAMFYDLEHPEPFLADIYGVMADDGLLVLQMSYTPLMLHQVAFDNICHEHIQYYTLTTIEELLHKSGFDVVDCQLNDVNGGSFRVYAMKRGADRSSFGTQPYRDVCTFRVNALLAHEAETQVNTPEVWYEFAERIQRLQKEVVDFVTAAVAEGKTVWGYGASTKGNTLLQFFGLDHTLIEGIAERSPYKYGRRTIGTNIPIYSEDLMREAKPDYLLVLPWHFIAEFVKRERPFLEAGGKFIVPCPEFQVIGA